MIAIKGYKMPKDCVDCVMQMGGWCGVSPPEVDERVAETVEDAINNGKPDWCPLVEIDAEPVRHGRMIDGRYPNDNKCSECGQTFRDDIGFIIQDNHGEFHYPKRCPECGCYWDGGADNDSE
jgi:hypothetical protein